MPEETLWIGSSSQIKNMKPFVACGVLAIAIFAVGAWLSRQPNLAGLPSNTILALSLVPIFIGVWKWLQVRGRKFQLTSERLLITNGVVNVATDSLELYRVKDIRMTQPLFLRFFNLENIELMTSDISSHLVRVDHVPKSANIGDKIRAQVEACRLAKGTREIEVE